MVPFYQISKAQTKEFADKVGKLLTHVYNYAKMLSVSSFSWPSRVVESEIVAQFDISNECQPCSASTFDLQYVSPAGHQECINAIVEAGTPKFNEESKNALATSFHCEASMDRTQKDKFMFIKVIDKQGSESL